MLMEPSGLSNQLRSFSILPTRRKTNPSKCPLLSVCYLNPQDPIWCVSVHNTHGPLRYSDSEKNENCRKVGRNFLIVAEPALGFGDRFRTRASRGDHGGRQNTATDNWWEYCYVFSRMKFNSVFRVLWSVEGSYGWRNRSHDRDAGK